MQMIFQSELTAARRRMPFFLVNSLGAPVTGVTGPTIYISVNGALSIVIATWSETGNGFYYLDLAASHVGTLGFVSVRVSHASIVTQAQTVQIVAFDPYTTPLFPETTVRQWGQSAFGVLDSTAAVDNSYSAEYTIDYIDNAVPSPKDLWMASWRDKAGAVATGVSNANLTLYDSDGSVKLNDATMIEVVNGSYKYEAIGAARIAQHAGVIAVFKADIGGILRSCRFPVIRR